MAQELEPLSPPWWLDRLNRQLQARQDYLQELEDYYSGKHRMAFATAKFRAAFGELFEAFADNWCDLVVDASVERLAVEGFRFGSPADDVDPDTVDDDEVDLLAGDTEAWDIWQANQLDADSPIAHTESVKLGEASVLVAPNPNRDRERYPLITIEHPSQMIVAMRAGSRRERAAALKQWTDESGVKFATLYLPDRIYKFQQDKGNANVGTARWATRKNESENGLPNPLASVPVVPLPNNPTLLGVPIPGGKEPLLLGRSDMARVIPLQDAVNKLVSDMLVASEFAAFRQRWATGLEVPTDPETGQPLPAAELQAAVSRLWAVADDDVTFGEFSASDLGNYVKAIETLIQHLAAQTRTPPHYLLGQSGAFPSGESLKATETGLVAKVRSKQRVFSEAWEEAMRLAFRLRGDEERGNAFDAETLWRNPESRTEGELVDSLTKMATLKVPTEALWERWGATPQERQRWRRMAMREALTMQGIDLNALVGEDDGEGDAAA